MSEFKRLYEEFSARKGEITHASRQTYIEADAWRAGLTLPPPFAYLSDGLSTLLWFWNNGNGMLASLTDEGAKLYEEQYRLALATIAASCAMVVKGEWCWRESFTWEARYGADRWPPTHQGVPTEASP